jgi:MoxR-like ATPase
MIRGRDHALPDDVQMMAGPVLAHRLLIAPESPNTTAAEVIADAVSGTRAL